MDIEASDLIVGLLMTAMGLVGLFLASGAHDDEMYRVRPFHGGLGRDCSCSA